MKKLAERRCRGEDRSSWFKAEAASAEHCSLLGCTALSLVGCLLAMLASAVDLLPFVQRTAEHVLVSLGGDRACDAHRNKQIKGWKNVFLVLTLVDTRPTA